MKKKKGLLYSVLLVTLLIPLLLLSLHYVEYNSDEASFLAARVLSRELSNYAESVETDFSRVLESSSRGAAVAAVNHVISSGAPCEDAADALEGLVLYADYGGEPSLLMAPSAQNNNSLFAWAARASQKGSYYGFNSSLEVTDFSVAQKDSFTLEVSAGATLTAELPAYGLRLQRSFSANATVPLEGVEDPLYPLESYGLVQRPISENESGVYGLGAFNGVVSSGTYWPSEFGPCFLARLEGSARPLDKYSSGGLASVVNLNEFIAQGIPVEAGKPVVDYWFFNETAPAALPVDGAVFDWVELDSSSAALYGVELE